MTRTAVGLDIGSSGIRAVELRPGRRPALRQNASVELPGGVVKSGVLADAEALTEALRELWDQGRFGSRSVALGLANDNVLVRQMDLEWMPPADFRKALRYQVADALPVPVDEANLDYHLLDEIETEATETEEARKLARVMLVAAGREMVDGYVHAVEAAGLRVVRADLVPFALVRAAGACEPAEREVVVVDIGADMITVALVRDGAPRAVRMISGVGGETVTHALQERYDWAWEDAERTKQVLGMVPGWGPEAQAEHPARTVVAEKAATLVAEILTTVEFFAGPVGERSFSRLLLTGRGSLLRGLDTALADDLGVEVSALAPFGGRRARDLDAEGWASYAVATGLCLGVK